MLSIQNLIHCANQAATAEQLQVANTGREKKRRNGCKQPPQFRVAPAASSHHSQLPVPSDPVPTGQVEP